MNTSFLAGFETLRFGSIVTKIVISCLGLLLIVGCKVERIPCDTGLEGAKTPPYFHIVERADEADTYTVSLVDERLTLLSELFEFQVNEGGQVMLPWPSCRDLDGFDEVRYLHLQKSAEVYRHLNESAQELCLGIPFIAETDLEDLSLYQRVDVPAGNEELGQSGWGPGFGEGGPPTMFIYGQVYPFHSTLIRTLSFLNDDDEKMAYPKVFISQGLEGKRATSNEEGQPPHILIRLWEFRGDAADKAREILGVDEIQDESFTCVDLYYGYFANE